MPKGRVGFALTKSQQIPILMAMDPIKPLPEGKLPPDILEKLLQYTAVAPEVSVGASCGEDAAVVRGADTIVLTSDPVTFTEERIGAYAVAVNANDVVAMGGRPRYLTTTLLLPRGTTEARCEEIFAEISAAAVKAGMLWVGGHTEVTPAVNRIVVCGHAVGFLSRPPLSTGGARQGDSICMTKWVGLEGTTLIAREKPREAAKVLGRAAHERVIGWLDDPGISIVEEGRALEDLPLTSGHDPTEGGIATGIREMCRASGTGALVSYDALPIKEETQLLCRYFFLDPLGLLSSGVFLFTAPPSVADNALKLLAAKGIPAARIGEVLHASHGVILECHGKEEPLRDSAQDEIVKLPR
jgi:hydrogenase expression/formation protein HypE